MKLRIKGDSLRLRISPSEMARLLQSGRVEETIHFSPQPGAKLTYALLTTTEPSMPENKITLQYEPQQVVVLVSAAQARAWAHGEQVGLYGEVNTGAAHLQLAVEKDFACLDTNAAENRDTFPNPSEGTLC